MSLLGLLNWKAIPLHEPLPLISSATVFVVIAATMTWILVKGYFPYLWREWITSVDHKRIGVMYCALASVMLVRGFIDALMMRSQLALATAGAQGFLPPDHYNQIFSAHGTIMIFFVAMTFMIGLMNFVMPLQLGIRDVAFPTLNSVSLWLTASGVLLINLSLVIGEFARTGWLAYPPLSELQFSPGVGVDYYLVALQTSGVGTLLAGINLITTILKMRAPGMSLRRMPIFCWTALASNLLIVAAFPILTATFAMLQLDRYLGFHFFTNDGGGNAMMYVNLIWAWGHPEVYILILPAFGVFSEVIATFSRKPLFGYRSMIIATMAICVLSFMVWLHHFFTMGAGADVNAFFGIMTMVIAVPTGVKVFNWLFTMWGGRIVFKTPMLWAIGFMVTFVVGGMTGVLMAVPPADFVLHNSLFLVAHFHNVVIGGVLFGAFAGFSYWFPKAFGIKLHEGLGIGAFVCWFVGFYLAFMPLYALGLEGMTRRMHHTVDPRWPPLLNVAWIGALVILAGIGFQAAQLIVSIRTRGRRRDETGDPWNGRTLEWATASPPAAFNFAVLPQVTGADPYWDMKQRAVAQQAVGELPSYEPIEMPRNTPTGVVVAFFATFAGFALIWHIWWMLIAGLAGALATFVWYAWRDETEFVVTSADAAAEDERQRATLSRRVRAHEFDRIGDLTVVSTSLGVAAPAGGVPVPAAPRTGEPAPRPEGGIADKNIVVGYGFWLFLVSDIILFAVFFAAYAVLSGRVNGGPTPVQLFHLDTVAIETGCLLLSTFACGLAALAARQERLPWAQIGLAVTGALGIAFVALEVNEFAHMVATGSGPSRSAFLSAFYALVGCHGLHVSAAILWCGTMMAQLWTKGFRPAMQRRMMCFTLFWHALDIVWVGVFTIVYLIGSRG